MTSVLNRKFDVLARSGTCPPYLLDVLSLLVAHANDTELFKTELRSAPVAGVAKPGQLQSIPQRDAEVTQAALEDSVKASHETILLAAEHSLRAYAEDLKNINDVAVATSAKQLHELRNTTRQEMCAFRDNLCEAAAEKCTRDLAVLRAEWLEGVRAETERLKNEIDQIAIAAERVVQSKVDGYTAFVAQAHEVLNAQPAVDTHVAVAASSLAVEQVSVLAASTAAKSDVELIAERLKQAERTIARMSADLFEDPRGEGSSRRGAAPAVAGQEPSALRTPQRRAGNEGVAAGLSPVVSLPVGSGHAPVPADRHSGSSPERQGSAHNAEAGAEVTVPSIGLRVAADDSGDGVAVVDVRPASASEAAGVEVGFIISHVGRTAVFTPAALQEAIDDVYTNARESNSRLTVYDPEAGRVRILNVKL